MCDNKSLIAEMAITSEDDLFLYFDLAEQLEAESILDVGMLLKRAGGVSRQLKDKEISRAVRLYGVDLFPEIICPVWETVYDHIDSMKSFCSSNGKSKYKLAYMLNIGKAVSEECKEVLWKRVLEQAEWIITDTAKEKFPEVLEKHESMNLKVGEKEYWLIRNKGEEDGYQNLCNDT